MNDKVIKIGAVVVGLLALYAVVALVFGLGKDTSDQATPTGPVRLEMWGLFDTSDTMRPILDAIERRTGLIVNYRGFTDVATYRQTLLAELASGEGPDVFMVSPTWLPKYRNIITRLPSEQLDYTPDDVRKEFVAAVATDLIEPVPGSKTGEEDILGLPMYVDSLALYYNVDHYQRILAKPSARPDPTWAGVRDEAMRLTVKDAADPDGLHLSGLALGRTDNITRGKELLYTLFLQNGGTSFIGQNSNQVSLGQEGRDALDFLTRFSRNPKFPEYGWNVKIGEGLADADIDAFARGEVSMIAGYSYYRDDIERRIEQLRSRGIRTTIDPDNIRVAPIPQALDPRAGNPKIALADYFAYTTARTSKHSVDAWRLVMELTTLASEKSYIAATGRPASRRELLDDQQKDAQAGVFAEQAVYAQSLPMMDDDAYADTVTKMVTAVADATMEPADAVSAAERYLSCELPGGQTCIFGRSN